jgi:hypothetical protein
MADRELGPQGGDSIAGNALGDQPTSIDSLGFAPYVDAIASFLTSRATKPPITISVEGEWGSGKSSFLLQLENAICGGQAQRPTLERLPRWLGGRGAAAQAGPRGENKALCIRFNAWRHDKQDALWAAFALAFVKSLRREVGFARAAWGDVLLFLKRLKGVRAWLELGLLVVSILALLVGAFVAWNLVSAHSAEAHRLLDWLLKVEPKPKPDAPKTVPGASTLQLIASTGTAGLLATLGVAGFNKFRAAFKMPLSLKLEKYIAKPDYEGHVSFIETFHLDLNRLIEAYAGDRRVFIFIDDLDRCDVPRAAELMQAINLMIGDSKNLVFIIGMDREKVAAGIAQKYKDILPFLRDSARWKPSDGQDDHTPLYFGYGYLEKFIQISFTLPVAVDEKALEGFFHEELPPRPAWRVRLLDYWRARLSSLQITIAASEGPATVEEVAAAVLAPERTYNRLAVEQQESDRIREVVKLVSPLFEYNPRRIKQFINTFRLALYIASDQGLFEDGRAPPASLEQIGKCVALLLRFPDLRFALEEDSHLLALLQLAAKHPHVERPATYHWLSRPGTIQLLADGDERHSLADFDVSQLFSVLPRAPGPPDVPEWSSDAVAVFRELARRYQNIRETEPAGNARTRNMDRLANEAIAEARRLSPMATVTRMLALLDVDERPGSRLMRILIAYSHSSPANLKWLLDFNRDFQSPFEHFWCIQTLLNHVDMMGATQRARINSDLNARWKEISGDTGRVRLALRLRELTRPRSGGMTVAAGTSVGSAEVSGGSSTLEEPSRTAAKVASAVPASAKTTRIPGPAKKARPARRKPTARAADEV